MMRKTVLLLGLLVLGKSLLPAQEKTPARVKFRVKTMQWSVNNRLLVVISEAGEKYTTYLHILFPSMKKGGKEDENWAVLFDNAYEAVLLQRIIALFSHKLAFSTNKYDEGQDQGEKKEARPKHLETFIWDVFANNLSVEITPGIFRNGAIVALNERLKYSFDLKKDTISLEDSSSSQLDESDAEMIRMFLDFFAIHARESSEWYEVEIRQRQKTLPSPEKAQQFLIHPVV